MPGNNEWLWRFDVQSLSHRSRSHRPREMLGKVSLCQLSNCSGPIITRVIRVVWLKMWIVADAIVKALFQPNYFGPVSVQCGLDPSHLKQDGLKTLYAVSQSVAIKKDIWPGTLTR